MSEVVVPQFIVYTLDPSKKNWIPWILNLGSDPYILASSSLEEALKDAMGIDPGSPPDVNSLRVVDTYFASLYRLNNSMTELIPVHGVDDIEADMNWYKIH